MRFTTLLLALALGVSGCASAQLQSNSRRAALTRQIADDAAAFNEAYLQAMSGQLLLNVLRARDRLPTQYLAMSAIQYAPEVTESSGLTLGNIALGGGIQTPFTIGEASVGRDMQLQPSFNIGPYSATDTNQILFRPEPPDVFGEYWNSGWSREMLLLLMAERIVRIDHGSGVVTEYLNDSGDFRDDCAASVDTDGCKYVRAVRELSQSLRGQAPDRRTDMSGVCGLAAAYAPPAARPHAANAPACDRAARVIVGDSEYVIFLRSLDDIVFYLGELARTQSANGYAAAVTVSSAGLSDARVPLFRVIEGDDDRHFAASVVYDGTRFSAGPAVSRDCAAAADGVCAADGVQGDRSAQVIALLMQLLLRNQSDQSVPPPPTVFIGRN